jgi:hypothetical protein
MTEGAYRAATANGAHTDMDIVIEAVARAVREIQYGSVLIKIHQSEVVGIETSTKIRLRDGASVPR